MSKPINLGEYHNGHFVKVVSVSNFFRLYQGYCLDDGMLSRMPDDQKILLKEKGKDGLVLLTTAGIFRQHGKPVNMGHGAQTCLSIGRWERTDNNYYKKVMS